MLCDTTVIFVTHHTFSAAFNVLKSICNTPCENEIQQQVNGLLFNRKKKCLTHAMTRTKLENNRLSGISQPQKDTHCATLLTRGPARSHVHRAEVSKGGGEEVEEKIT